MEELKKRVEELNKEGVPGVEEEAVLLAETEGNMHQPLKEGIPPLES